MEVDGVGLAMHWTNCSGAGEGGGFKEFLKHGGCHVILG